MNSADYADALTTLADAQAWAREVLAGVLASHADAGIIADALITPTPGSPVEFDSKSAAVATLEGVARALLDGNLTTAWWPDIAGDWHELQQPGTDDFSWQLSMSLVKYRQDCNDNAKAKAALIDAAASIDDVLAVSMATGWPSRSVVGGFAIPSGGGGGVQVDIYDTPGTYTWTKPTGAKLVRFVGVGAGGGGAGGSRGAAGTYRRGGGGAGGGAFSVYEMDAAAVPAAALTVEVGAGGTGGAGATVDDTDGTDGGTPGYTGIYDPFPITDFSIVFWEGFAGYVGIDEGAEGGGLGSAWKTGDVTAGPSFLCVQYGNDIEYRMTTGAICGRGGLNGFGFCAYTGGGGGGSPDEDGQRRINYGSALANASFGGGGSIFGAGGGGAGGSIRSTDTAMRGGVGGASVSDVPGFVFGDPDYGAGENGANGATPAQHLHETIAGGGGGGGAANLTGNGGNGGNGASPGGGGGGGGAAVNGSNGGAGGNGGDGYIIITTFF